MKMDDYIAHMGEASEKLSKERVRFAVLDVVDLRQVSTVGFH